MKRYINYQLVTDHEENEVLLEKTTTGDEPEYHLEIRDCCGECVVQVCFTPVEFNAFVKMANKLKREE